MSQSNLINQLRDAREKQLALFSDLDVVQLLGVQEHHIEPPIWEMGHVAWFQEYWILRHLDAAAPTMPAADGIYDAFNVSYKRRWSHDFPSREETLTYAADVLQRCTDRLADRVPSPEEAYFYHLAAMHEGMHSENLLAVRQSLAYPRPAGLSESAGVTIDPSYEAHDVAVPEGRYLVGAAREYPFVFDNEKWAHEVELEPFHIASAPVTNAEYAQFVDSGGYTTRSHWDRHAWEWRRRGKFVQPLTWVKQDGRWHERIFDQLIPLAPGNPVCHVNWHEAKAYAKFAGRRLPTEAEWEVAASYDPATGQKHMYPWGAEAPTVEHANLGLTRTAVVDVSAFPAGDSPLGCRQMLGNVWEWTSSILEPYPGFKRDPYAEYSEPYFGQKPVLRGGCFATRPDLIRTTWRNFFIRHRRNIFAGFRTCAVR